MTAEEAIDLCAEIADKEGNLLLFTGARFRGLAVTHYFNDADLHEQAGMVAHTIRDKIRALKDASAVTRHES
jgi:hypothetical protein